MKIKTVSVEIDLKDADVLIQALESLWDNNVLIPRLNNEEEEEGLAESISGLKEKIEAISNLLGGEDEKQDTKN